MQNAAWVIFLSHLNSHSNEQNSRAVKRKFLMATRLRIDLSDWPASYLPRPRLRRVKETRFSPRFIERLKVKSTSPSAHQLYTPMICSSLPTGPASCYSAFSSCYFQVSLLGAYSFCHCFSDDFGRNRAALSQLFKQGNTSIDWCLRTLSLTVCQWKA